MIYHFTYITASDYGFFYVGRHSTKNLKDGYQGSGKWIKLCKKYKVPLHTRILNFYDNLQDLKNAEEVLIENYYCFEGNMNLSVVSSGFPVGDKNPAKRKEVIAKRPQNNKGAKTSWFCDPKRTNPGALEYNRIKNSYFMKNLWQNPEYRKNKIDNHHMKKDLYKENFRINNPMFNTEVKEKVRSKILQSVLDGTHNSKILLECPTCKKITSKPNASRWHFNRCKFLRQP